MVWTAITVALIALIAQHLGLTEELAKIALKVSKCPKCTVFWLTLSVLILSGYDVIAAVALSLIMAYLSFWAGFLLIALQKLYDWIWKKVNRT